MSEISEIKEWLNAMNAIIEKLPRDPNKLQINTDRFDLKSEGARKQVNLLGADVLNQLNNKKPKRDMSQGRNASPGRLFKSNTKML